MTDKALEARRAYKRKWAKENPDKVKAAQERFYNKLAAAQEPDGEPPTENEQGGD